MINYSQHGVLTIFLQWRGSVVPKGFLLVLPPCFLTLGLLFWEDFAPVSRGQYLNTVDIQEGTVWALSTVCTFALLGFRMRQAQSRFWEGASLLVMMQGEWFESASCLVSFSHHAMTTKPDEVKQFRHSLIRLMSFLHSSALEEIQHLNSSFCEVIDFGGLDIRTLTLLKECTENYGFNRVEFVLHLVQNLVTTNHHAGVITIPPPILSRVYQTLSRGMVHCINARKISDVLFPYPWVQLCGFAIVFHSIFTPFVVTAIVRDKVWAVVATAIPLLGMNCINLVSTEIEMPYGNDPNDLPLGDLRAKFNKSMIMLLMDCADHVPAVGHDAILEWDDLYRQIRPSLCSFEKVTKLHVSSHNASNNDFVAARTTRTKPNKNSGEYSGAPQNVGDEIGIDSFPRARVPSSMKIMERSTSDSMKVIGGISTEFLESANDTRSVMPATTSLPLADDLSVRQGQAVVASDLAGNARSLTENGTRVREPSRRCLTCPNPKTLTSTRDCLRNDCEAKLRPLTLDMPHMARQLSLDNDCPPGDANVPELRASQGAGHPMVSQV